MTDVERPEGRKGRQPNVRPRASLQGLRVTGPPQESLGLAGTRKNKVSRKHIPRCSDGAPILSCFSSPPSSLGNRE